MGIVKELIKAPVERKLYNKYYSELEYSFFSYDSFANMREKAVCEDIAVTEQEAGDRIEIVEYDSVNSLDLNSLSREITLFVADKAGFNSKSMVVIASVMEKNEEVKVLYGDEDEINSNGKVRMNPWFKPGWSPDTLLDYYYFGGAVAVRTDYLREKYNNQKNIYELILDLTEFINSKSVKHINFVLYHSHYLKKLYSGSEYKELRGKYCRKVDNIEKYSVSIIIPSKDNPEILEKCIRSLLKFCKGKSIQIIIVDNGSNEDNKCKIEGFVEQLKLDLVSGEYVENQVDNIAFEYMYNPQPFNFSRMCNQGARAARGELLLFLNDDVEAREGRFLDKMMEIAVRKHAGAVGAKLYYPDSMMIQHAGITNLRLGPVHKLQFKDDNAHYYMDMNNGVRNCIAVTGACLLIDKSKFIEVGGFAEELEVAFNDVDLCFRLYESGYHNVVCNNTHLWHHESLSRGQDSSDDKLARLTDERKLLYERHPKLYGRDPYYSDCMSTDILDTNYSFIYEYDYRDVLQDGVVIPFKKTIREQWYNECLMISLEYAGDLEKFENQSNKASDYALISGYAFVAGSDNALFTRSIVLKGEKSSYIVKAADVFRPDLEINVNPEEYALMTGFCLKINMKNLPADTYRIGVLAECGSSRLKLYGETNKYIRVNDNNR